MRIITLTLFLVISFRFVFSQSQKIDSLKQVIKNEPNDAVRFQLYNELSSFYSESDRDSALYYIEKTITLANGKGQYLVTASALTSKGYQLTQKGNFRDALKYILQAITNAEEVENERDSWLIYLYNNPETIKPSVLANVNFRLGLLMAYAQNYEQALLQLRKARRNAILLEDESLIASAETALSRVYIQLNKLDTALIFANSAEQSRLRIGSRQLTSVYWYEGNIHFLKGNMQIAKTYYWKGIKSGLEYQNMSGLARNYYALTKLYLAENEKDSSLFYALKSLELTKVLKAQNDNDPSTAYENLYLSYLKRNQLDSAFKYQGLALIAKDSLYLGKIKSLAEFQELTYQEQLRLKELEKEKESYQNKLKQYALLTGLGVLLPVAFILYRNNRQKQKANIILQVQKDKVESTLSQLKVTQAQLIQSEKMASLGELTAGIAHEIQNPLNFVNNFSELNNELIKELKTEVSNGNIEEVLTVVNDIEANSEKINQHGQRASSIVKGMLEHSRKSSGEKTLTDINAMCDEYLRLSYHGLRAKDKNFYADFKTDLDPNMPKINVISQDIARVLLNIINNAFQACAERGRKEKGDRILDDPSSILLSPISFLPYSPLVSLTTKYVASLRPHEAKATGQVCEIRISDNGLGIPDSIKDKIFQPFFTTKPTGQGTGLGLSLAYDIVKAHGGDLLFEKEEEIGTKFIILIPIK